MSSLLIASLIAMLQALLPQQVVGTWVRTVETHDPHSGTEERQTTRRTFMADGRLQEAVDYEQHIFTPDGEPIVLTFSCQVDGTWTLHNENDILLGYRHRHVRVDHTGMRFPDHADEVQAELRSIFMKKNASEISNYVDTMRHILKRYYRRNHNSLIRRVSIEGNTMTATLGDEEVSLMREIPQ
ncbi:MAG: hypothetical protein SPL64_06360 [Bacteroidaceae bacterium]|nr:hypothetical protein [Bacteroidaceae bacterium]